MRRPPSKWVFADDGRERHDSAHLVTHRLQVPLAAFARQLEGGQGGDSWRRNSSRGEGRKEDAEADDAGRKLPSQVHTEMVPCLCPAFN